jgi:predicted AAA+ superfamily ATPase
MLSDNHVIHKDCHESAAELANSPFLGALFEGFIAAEIAKAPVNRGRRPEIYFFRDEQGLEVDFLVPRAGGSISLVECKAARTVTPAMAGSMQRLAEAFRKKRPRGTRVEMSLVHQAPKAPVGTHAVAPGVRACAWQEFVGRL